MNAGVGIGLFICLVIIAIVGVMFKCSTECDIGYLDRFYHSLDKRCDDMFDIIKMQQEEIKELRRMIEPPDLVKEEKKCCCGNCRFYYELNNQSSACLNINNYHKDDSTIYANNIPLSCWMIKGVKPNDCCEYYESKEGGAERRVDESSV